MRQSLEILATQDGSRTLYSNQYKQAFHSTYGALTGSKHVFLEGSGIKELLQPDNKVSVLEIGFGTGLNWLLTASLAIHLRTQLDYTALDQQIPCTNLLSKLGHADLVSSPFLMKMLIQWRGSFSGPVPDGWYHLPHNYKSSLQFHIGDAVTVALSPHRYDCIYLDAFSPQTNPQFWTFDFIQKLYNALREGGRLATYSAAGHVRRTLTECGFAVIRRPGPPGKREVLAARKPNS